MIKAGISIRDAWIEASRTIATVDRDNPDKQAEWMLAHILELKAHDLRRVVEMSLNASQAYLLESFIQRRLEREPLQYILGNIDFRHINLKVDRRALIPRPETEGLVEIGLEKIADLRIPKIFDIGTGSGAIVLSILSEHPDAFAVAIDNSPDALALACENAALLNLAGRIHFIHQDIYCTDNRGGLIGQFDLIISNPPYVTEDEYDLLQPEIALYEPRNALIAGKDGMNTIRRLATLGKTMLQPNGWMVVEIGENQAEQSLITYRNEGWQVELQKDLSGKIRYLTAQLP
jgi:release factor glutamine methyltransferase